MWFSVLRAKKWGKKKRLPTVVTAICRVNMSAGICFDTREVSACRGPRSGFLKVPLVNVWDQRRLKSVWGAFLHSCCYAAKTAFSIFRCSSIDFYKKNPNTGRSRFKTGNKFWDAERDIMLVSAFVCLFHRQDICCKPEKWNTATIYIF